MRTYDEIRADARRGAPFANNSMGLGWMHQWCYRCVHEQPTASSDSGCPILLAASDRTPREWTAETARDEVFGAWSCLEFRDRDGWRGWDDDGPALPPPVLPVDGQITLEEYAVERLLEETTAAVA